MDEIKVKLTADSTDLDKKITEMQKKIEKMRQLSSGTGAMMNNPNAQAFQERASSNLKKQLTQELKVQNREMMKLEKAYVAIDKRIKSSQMSQQAKTKALKEEEKILDSILAKRTSIGNLQSALGPGKQPLQGMERLGAAYRGGGLGGVGRAMSRMGPSALMGLAGTATLGAGAIVGGGAAGATQLADWRYWKAGLPSVQAGRAGSIAQSTSQLTGRAINEQSYEDIMFGKQDRAAWGGAMDFFGEADPARKFRAKAKAVGGLAGTAVGAAGLAGAGAYGGAKLGGMIGSVGGLPGALLGAGIGTIAGGIGGALVGGGMSMMGYFGGNEEAYYGLTDNSKALSGMSGKDAMMHYETQKTANRFKDPTQYYQKKFVGENMEKLLAIQRSSGLSDDGMYGSGGFTQRGGGEFLFSERAGMQQSIVGAGGSGSSAANLNVMALKAQRGLGMTNAGQTMGKLSSYLDKDESEEAFVKILAKGMTIGLDGSEFREEQKDYFAQVTAIAQNIGTGENYIASSLAAGVEGDISRRSIGMAASGHQRLETNLNEQGGITAAARATALLGDDAFKDIGGFDFLTMSQMKMGDINADSAELKGYYKKAKAGGYKGSIEDFAKARRGAQREGLIGGYRGTVIGDTLSDIMKAGDVGELTEEQLGKGAAMLRNTGNFGNMNEKELQIMLKQYAGAERKAKESNIKRGKIKAARAKKARIEAYHERESSTRGGYRPEGEVEKMSKEDLRYAALDEGGKDLGAEKVKGEMGKMQAKVFENMDKVFDEIASNVDESLAQKLEMKEFNDALRGGADSVTAFLAALKGEPIPRKKKPMPVRARNKPENISNNKRPK